MGLKLAERNLLNNLSLPILSAELLFGAALLTNAMLFVPQAWKIFKYKKSEEVSLITFGGFWLTQLLTVIHAIINHDHILLIGYILAMVTCGWVITLTLFYRLKKQ